MQKIKSYFPLLGPISLFLFSLIFYYKLFLLGRIPFPGDLLITSYSPWFDYYRMPTQNPLISDVFSQLFIWKYLGVEQIMNGQWPLWNPYSFAGNPLLANYQSAVLYPLNLFLLIPTFFGWGIFIYSQTLVAMLGMYFLLSTWMKNTTAKIVGAVVFALGGLMTTWLELGTAGHAMAWLPFSFYALIKFLELKKFRYLFLLVIAQLFTILAGNLQVTLYSFIILGLFILLMIRKSIFSTVIIMFCFLITILLAMPQLLPSYEFFGESIRIHDTYIQTSNYGLIPLIELSRLFAGDIYGNPVTRNYFGSLNYFETSSFIGSLSLIFILYLFFKRKKILPEYFFLGLFFASLILVIDNPISHFIYTHNIPLINSSFASRMLFVTGFSAAISVAFGLQNFLDDRKQYLKKFTVVIVSLVVVALLCFISFRNANIEQTSTVMRNSIIPLGLLGSTLFGLLLVFFNDRFSLIKKNLLPLLGIAITILFMADLGRYFLKFNTFVSQEFIFPTTPSIAFLEQQKGIFRIGRDHGPVLPPNTWSYYKLSSYEGYDPLYYQSYSQFMHFLNGGDLREVSSSRYAELGGNFKNPFLDALNTKYFIAPLYSKIAEIRGDQLSGNFDKTGYPIVFQDRSSAILENPNASERAYFAKSVLTLNSIKDVQSAMMEKSFDPTTTAALTTNTGLTQPTGTGSIEISSYTPNKITIKTITESDQLLILADQYTPGWKATINNQVAPILQTNYIFRGIKVPAGKQEINFYYEPSSFKIGLYSFIFGLLLLVGLIGILSTRKYKL